MSEASVSDTPETVDVVVAFDVYAAGGAPGSITRSNVCVVVKVVDREDPGGHNTRAQQRLDDAADAIGEAIERICSARFTELMDSVENAERRKED